MQEKVYQSNQTQRISMSLNIG